MAGPWAAWRPTSAGAGRRAQGRGGRRGGERLFVGCGRLIRFGSDGGRGLCGWRDDLSTYMASEECPRNRSPPLSLLDHTAATAARVVHTRPGRTHQAALLTTSVSSITPPPTRATLHYARVRRRRRGTPTGSEYYGQEDDRLPEGEEAGCCDSTDDEARPYGGPFAPVGRDGEGSSFDSAASSVSSASSSSYMGMGMMAEGGEEVVSEDVADFLHRVYRCVGVCGCRWVCGLVGGWVCGWVCGCGCG